MDKAFVEGMRIAATDLLDEIDEGEPVNPDRMAVLLSFWLGVGLGATERAEELEAKIERYEAEH